VMGWDLTILNVGSLLDKSKVITVTLNRLRVVWGFSVCCLKLVFEKNQGGILWLGQSGHLCCSSYCPREGTMLLGIEGGITHYQNQTFGLGNILS